MRVNRHRETNFTLLKMTYVSNCACFISYQTPTLTFASVAVGWSLCVPNWERISFQPHFCYREQNIYSHKSPSSSVAYSLCTAFIVQELSVSNVGQKTFLFLLVCLKTFPIMDPKGLVELSEPGEPFLKILHLVLLMHKESAYYWFIVTWNFLNF